MMQKIKKILLITLLALATGCVGKQTTVKHPPCDAIVFNQNYQSPMYYPKQDPKSYSEYYSRGCFLFDHGQYSQAAQDFIKAGTLACDKEAKLYAHVAAALSALGANDIVPFKRLRNEINEMINENWYLDNGKEVKQAISSLNSIAVTN